MNVLLLSMPDSFEHMAPVAVRMPNGALTSLAGNVDPQHRVAVADLILVQGRVTATVDRLLAEHQPDVVGLSVMTFQRRTALRLIERIRRAAARGADRRRRLRSEPRAGRLTDVRRRLHRPRRRRDHVPRAAARARAEAAASTASPASATATASGFRHTADRPVSSLDETAIAPAARATPACSRRLHAARPAGRRHRDLARLHLRLQLLLDHRDARPQLPHLRLRPRPRRHPRLPRPRRPGALHRRRQHHARREALRGALPGDHRRRAATTSNTWSRR